MQETVLLEDVQSEQDARNIALQKVGIKGVKRPIQFVDAEGVAQHTVADCHLYVNLPATVKGTHMSRFIELLEARRSPVSVFTIHEWVADMCCRLGSDDGYLDMSFTYFKTKQAPVSGAKSLLDYEVTLQASVVGGQKNLRVLVDVPMMSLCPCSKKIATFNAHNQRASVKVWVEAEPVMSVDRIIAIAEQGASSQLYALVKRADEKYITEAAYQNPKFVEDMARELAQQLEKEANVRYYRVCCENFESIHNHSAYAEVTRQRPTR